MLLGPPQIYEVRLPVRIGERPFGTVQVGVSTSLVRQTLRDALLRSLAFGAGALAFAIALGLGTGRVLLGYLRRIARRVERLARGDAAAEFGPGDDMGRLAARMQGLGERIQATAGGASDPGAGRRRAPPERRHAPRRRRRRGLRQRERRPAARPDARRPLARRRPPFRAPAGRHGRDHPQRERRAAPRHGHAPGRHRRAARVGGLGIPAPSGDPAPRRPARPPRSRAGPGRGVPPELLPEAGGAGTPHVRRDPRGQEPAQRDAHPPRALARAARPDRAVRRRPRSPRTST